MSTALVEIRSAVEKMAPQFKAALPAHVPVERFVRTTLTAVQTNQALLDADRRTLFAAATKAAQTGLLPDGREGAIVTFRRKDGTVEAQWMPMVAGIMKLVRNSGEISTRPVPSISTSMALPRKMRFHHWASMGRDAIRAANFSHSGRGNTIRQPCGCLVMVSCPWAVALRTSRCRVGTDSRPLASRLSDEAP